MTSLFKRRLGILAVREILPYGDPSTLVGPGSPAHWQTPLLLSYPHSIIFKRNHDKLSYYFTLSAIPLREHVYHLSRHTRWDAGSTTVTLPAYRFLQAAQGEGP